MADQIMTQNWMEQLGAEDGARLAAEVLDELYDADTQERIDGVSLHTLGALAGLANEYRERGVSDALLLAWRIACHEEMKRVFSRHRENRQAVAA